MFIKCSYVARAFCSAAFALGQLEENRGEQAAVAKKSDNIWIFMCIIIVILRNTDGVIDESSCDMIVILNACDRTARIESRIYTSTHRHVRTNQ